MTAYQFRMPTGIPGDVNRAEICTVEPQVITPAGNANAPTAYGIGVLIDATTGQVRAPTTGDTAILGLLVREYPTQGGQADGLGPATLPLQGECSVMTRGFMSVVLGGTTAASKTAPVYVRLAGGNGTTKIVGQFEAAADATPANTLLIPNARWTGPAGADGITEIAFNI